MARAVPVFYPLFCHQLLSLQPPPPPPPSKWQHLYILWWLLAEHTTITNKSTERSAAKNIFCVPENAIIIKNSIYYPLHLCLFFESNCLFVTQKIECVCLYVCVGEWVPSYIFCDCLHISVNVRVSGKGSVFFSVAWPLPITEEQCKMAIIRCAFIPSLPLNRLSISTESMHFVLPGHPCLTLTLNALAHRQCKLYC